MSGVMRGISLAGREVPTAGDVFVIAEAGVNHNGRLDLAHRLVDVAADAGADAVKFQTFDPAKLVSSGAASTPYQRERGGATDQLSLLRALTLPAEAWAALREHAEERGIAFLSTPFDLDSARMLVDLGVPALKVSSGELTNLPYLRRLAVLGVPLLVSTGMGDAAEVAAAVHACAPAPGLALFHCVSAYPAPLAEANLRVIPALVDEHGVPVGWSDHTPGLTAALGAVALGASLLEKHMTTDRGLPGPDHAASVEPSELTDYVAQAKALAGALGDGVKRRMPSEVENAGLVRRSWHAAVDLPAGTVLTEDHLVLLRPETGLSPTVEIVGRVAGPGHRCPPARHRRRPVGGRATMTAVAVFVGTRADLGPLTPVIEALSVADDVTLLLCRGWPTAPTAPADTLAEVAAVRVRPLAPPLAGLDEPAILAQGPLLSAGMGALLGEERPDVLVVLGDRWELLHVVPPAVIAGVPVVHLHGGEVTEGALDERVRHAVTKLADQHCVASEDAAARVRRLGEPADRVHVTGAPGLDRLAGVGRPDDATLAGLLGTDLVRPLALFTYHPPTAVGVRRWADGPARPSPRPARTAARLS